MTIMGVAAPGSLILPGSRRKQTATFSCPLWTTCPWCPATALYPDHRRGRRGGRRPTSMVPPARPRGRGQNQGTGTGPGAAGPEHGRTFFLMAGARSCPRTSVGRSPPPPGRTQQRRYRIDAALPAMLPLPCPIWIVGQVGGRGRVCPCHAACCPYLARALPAWLLQPSAHAINREHRPAAACPGPGPAPRPPQAPSPKTGTGRTGTPPRGLYACRRDFFRIPFRGRGQPPLPRLVGPARKILKPISPAFNGLLLGLAEHLLPYPS